MKLFSRNKKNQFAPRNITLPEARRTGPRRWVWVLIGIVTIGILVAILQYTLTQVFKIEKVQVELLVESKPFVAPVEQMNKLAANLKGDSLILLNEQDIMHDWQTRMPSLEKVYVHKELPNTVIIEYVPRVAYSQLVSPQDTFLVDREGYIFAKTEQVDYLPKVLTDQEDIAIGTTTSAKGVRLSQHLIEGLRNTNPRLKSILLRDGVLEITMTGDPKLLISDDKAALPTLREINAIFSKFAADEKYAKEVDMRFDRPVLRY